MQDSCKKGQWLRATVFTTSLTIVDLVILLVFFFATVEVLPIVAYSTISLTMTMTTAPVFQGYDSIAGIRLAVESLIANQSVVVGFFVVEECRRLLVPSKPWLYLISLHLTGVRESTCYRGLSDSSIQSDFCVGFVLHA